MSADETVAKDLVQTLKDGQEGYRTAAERLSGDEHDAWAQTMAKLAQQRAGFADEIVQLGHEYGDDVDRGGSAVAAVHRGWLSLKDAVTGDDPQGVLGAAVTGEDHSVSEYEKALEADLSDGFRAVVQRQHEAVVAARAEVKALHESA